MVTYQTVKRILFVINVMCFGHMSGGVAWQLSQHYPGLEEDYRKYCERHNFDYSELKGRYHSYITDNNKAIVNMFSQKPNFVTDYEAMERCLYQIKRDAMSSKATIAIPYGIGCGIANGDWEEVYRVIDKVFKGYKVTLYKLKKG